MKTLFFSLFALFLVIDSAPKEVTWVAIGDSITYLNDHQDETGNRISKGYLTLIGEEFPNLKIVNKGYNGWTAVAIAEQFHKLDIPKADIYSIFLGTNDWWAGKPLGTIQDFQDATGIATVHGAFRAILDNIRSLNPEAKIVILTPMKRVDFVYINDPTNNAFGSYQAKNQQDLESFADALKNIGKEADLPVIDLYHHSQLDFEDLVHFKWMKNPASGDYQKYAYPDFIGVPFDPKVDVYPYPTESIAMTYDGLHPSDAGYQLIFECLLPYFKEWM